MNPNLEFRQQREIIALQYKHKNENLALSGRQLVYVNQREAAVKCFEAYEKGAVAVVLYSPPGAGKTGVGLETMRLFGQHPDDNRIKPVNSMYQITGMSDRDWKEQCKNNVLDIFKENVFHRGNIQNIQDKLSEMENGLVICDECHIAAGKNMLLSRTLRNAGLLDLEQLQERKILLLDISATPETVLHDYKDWGDKVAFVRLEPSEDYKGFEVLKQENRIRQSSSLEKYEDAVRLLKFFDERYKNSTKKYFPFRVPEKGQSRINLVKASSSLGWSPPKNHDSNDKIHDIDDDMNFAPAKHTIIFIKGFWRASKRINDTHVGGSYEMTPKIRDTSSTAQGLTARFCSTFRYKGDQLNIELRPIHYSDLEAINEYLEWVSKDCDYTRSSYSGPRIHSRRGVVTSKASKVHHTNVAGLGHIAAENERLSLEERRKKYRVFKNFTNCRDFLKVFGKKTKFGENPNGEGEYAGMYVCNLSTSVSKPNYLTEAIEKVSYKTGGGKSGKRALPVYLDVKDKDSIVWFVFVPDADGFQPIGGKTHAELLQIADEKYKNEADNYEPQAKDFRTH
jgi:hypothetical protein